MKKSDNGARPARREVAYLLSTWWTRPDPETVALWATPAYARLVRDAWKADRGETAAVDKLLWILRTEQHSLAAEYERLFVGPAPAPCPPYEAMWHTDRPPHERGTVVGQSTDEVKKLYSLLGLRMRPDEVELPDHVAIELEALAYASDVSGDAAESLRGRLRSWLPKFCDSVMANSRLEFYRSLAEVSIAWFAGSNGRSGIPLGEKTNVRRQQSHTGEKR